MHTCSLRMAAAQAPHQGPAHQALLDSAPHVTWLGVPGASRLDCEEWPMLSKPKIMKQAMN